MKTWLITGCSTGFGAAIAEAALERGDRVMLTARSVEKLTAIADRYPQTALQAAVDVTEPASIAAAIAATEAAFGGIDIFVNNAGYGVIGAVEEVSSNEYRRMFETNVFGLIEATRLALPALRKSRGVLVNLSSNAGIWTRSGFGLYGATKAGVELISEALAQEVAPMGVRVLIVEPGAFRTDFLGRSMTRAEQRLAIYDGTAGQMRDFSESVSGNQPGDPVKGAAIILQAIDDPDAPLRLPLGPDAHRNIRSKLDSVAADMAVWADRTTTTDFAEPENAG
jgi:NAD(P)-dependent dehydrogenase (short-subunit alcohol dehydrogenase family)